MCEADEITPPLTVLILCELVWIYGCADQHVNYDIKQTNMPFFGSEAFDAYWYPDPTLLLEADQSTIFYLVIRILPHFSLTFL